MGVEYGALNKYSSYGQPSLDLVFTGPKKSLRNRIGNQQVEFTRGSTATYTDENGIIRTAAQDEARFDHDPETGESLGLLVEESRTNRMLYSEDFTQTYYSKSFCTVATTSVISPDGVSTANALVEDANNDERYVQNTGGFPLGQFTTSVFVKAGTRSFCYLNFTDSGTNSARSAYFNLTTGEFQIVAAPTPSITLNNLFAEQHPNGWWRIGATVAGGRGTQFILGPATALTPPAAVGARETYQGVNGDEALYMWGAQSENSQDNGSGLFATSYIPTSGSTETRAADVASLTNSSIYNTDSFTILNEPFGSAAGASTLSLVGAGETPIKRTTVYSQNLTQTQINASVGKTDEFWQWRILGSSFGLPSFTTDGQVTVDWGDGTVETLTTSDHTFTDGGGYHEVGFRLDSGTYFRPYINNNASHDTKVVALGPAPESMTLNGERSFYGCTNLEVFDATVDVTGGTNFQDAWYSCSSLTSFPAIDLSGATNVQSAWRGCSSMTTFSPTNMSNCSLFGANTTNGNFGYGAWRSCTSLSSFPAADMSSATDIGWAWYGCSSMTSFGSITLPTGTPTYGAPSAWYDCSSLTSFPAIDLSGATNLQQTWRGCISMTTFSPTDMSNCTSFGLNTTNGNFGYGAWRSCTSLTAFPAADMSSATDIGWAWYDCSSMTTFGSITLPTGTPTYGASSAWYGCSSLTSFPAINLSGATNLQQTWRGCSSMTTFSPTDMSNCTSFGLNTTDANYGYGAWRECTLLTSFPAADMSSATDIGWAWAYCYSMTSFGSITLPTGTPTYSATSAWNSCSSLTSFPAIDLSGATNVQSAWRGCSSMTTFSPTDMSNCTLFGSNNTNANFGYGAWRECTLLTSFPAADMSSATDIGWAWAYCYSMTSFGSITLPTGSPTYGATSAWNSCSSLTSFPAINLSGATDLREAWRGCSSMTTFSPTDMSNCTLFGTDTTNGNFAYGAWRSCTSLTSFPAADMSSGIDYGWAWYGCSSMTSFGSCIFNTTSTSTFRYAWASCSSLTTFPPNMFDNVIATVFNNAFTGCALTVQSVENILVSLDTGGQLNGFLDVNGGTTAGQASWTTAATTAYNNLVTKGWTISANP